MNFDRGNTRSRASSARAPEATAQIRALHRHAPDQDLKGVKRTLRVMKFGGTSVADASCIRNVVEIIRASSQASDLVVVVSAMAGVTNKLIEAAVQSEAGNHSAVEKILQELQNQHARTVESLIESSTERDRLGRQMQELFEQAHRLCEGTKLLRELTPRAKDLISSLGERLAAPMVAAALTQLGVASEALEATELIVTDSYHGGAEPWMDQTRERCEMRLHPLVQRGVLPIVTGFIGATEEGTLTTLGRGGSDYSASILAAALEADEVVIWTDVDGLLTADPRLVPGACSIPEISYREAAELAYFGAKVLHPKTLRALMESGIPVWIRNTFTPERAGTQITRTGPDGGNAARALAVISDAAMITLGGPCLAEAPEVLGRTLAATSAVRSDVLLVSQSSAQNEVCLVVPASHAKRTVEGLRHEFAQELAHQQAEHVKLDSEVAIVTVVGQDLRRVPGTVGRLFGALGKKNINVMAIAQGSSDCKLSYVVEKAELRAALVATHHEFQFEAVSVQAVSMGHAGEPAWYYEPQQPRADAD